MGKFLNSSLSASKPPAEAPIATMGNNDFLETTRVTFLGAARFFKEGLTETLFFFLAI
jgi:hypothetical protein